VSKTSVSKANGKAAERAARPSADFLAKMAAEEQDRADAKEGAKKGARMRSWDGFGNGDRFLDYWGDRFRWMTDAGVWYRYDGSRWVMDDTMSYMKASARMVVDECMTEREALLYSDIPEGSGNDAKSPRDEFVAWAKTQRETHVTLNMVRDVGMRTDLFAELSEFDDHPMHLNVLNGVVDLAERKLVRHSPELHMLQVANVRYSSAAKAPMWNKFLRQVQPDKEARDCLQRSIGYTLTGNTGEQVFFGHYGDGANGKGVFWRVIRALMGAYAQNVPKETFLISKASAIPNDLARMVGKRLLLVPELPPNRRFNEALLQEFSGEDTVTARFLNKEWFEFAPVGKIHFYGNHPPLMEAGGAAMERRMRDFGWDVTIPPARRDKRLAARIIDEELPGVLNWCLDGVEAWSADGLAIPESVTKRTAAHVRNADPLYEWMDECLELLDAEQYEAMREGEGGWDEWVMDLKHLYESYSAWCDEKQVKYKLANRGFGDRLTKRGIHFWKKDDKTRRKLYVGAKLFEPEAEGARVKKEPPEGAGGVASE
jgi:putative DNA primase/helicase